MMNKSVNPGTGQPGYPWNPVRGPVSKIGKFQIAVKPKCKSQSSPTTPAPVENHYRSRRKKKHCKYAVIFVAEHFGVPIDELMSQTRANAAAARARQIAAYVSHTTLSISYANVAEFFRRDRTTISHACKTVEDCRDDKCFDAKLCMVENLVAEAVDFTMVHGVETAPRPQMDAIPGSAVQ